jgi:anti-sigma factor RsiW
MITCRELIDFIIDYVDNALPPEQRKLFEEHLGVCPECVAYLNDYKTAVRVSRDACGCGEPADRESGIPDRLVQAILAARRGGAG